MRRRALCLGFMCLSAGILWLAPPPCSAAAELRVNETATRLRWLEDRTEVSLAVHNDWEREIVGGVTIELIDEVGTVRSRGRGRVTLQPGANVSTLSLEPALSTLDPADRARALHYRLRYRISSEVDEPPNEGIIAVSGIAKGLYELRIVHPRGARPGRPYRVSVLASHPASSLPVEGVEIESALQIEDRDAPLTTSAVTGGDGVAILDLQLPQDVHPQEASLTITSRGDGITHDVSQEVTISQGSTVINISTDKSLYQPGQTLHMRVLAFDGSRRSVADGDARIQVFDPARQLVSSAPVRTSRFGVASVDWPIPQDAKLGSYRIEATLDATDRSAGSNAQEFVSVRRYELPAFSVVVKPDRPFYLPGQEATVKVQAEYLFGEPVTEGRVQLVGPDGETLEESLDGTGGVTAWIDLNSFHDELAANEHERSRDLDLAAYVTDA